MARLIWVPQYPVYKRYQEWWEHEIPKGLSPYFDRVVKIDGQEGLAGCPQYGAVSSIFGNMGIALKWELAQTKKLLDINWQEGDVLLFGDISFAGIAPQIMFYVPDFVCCYGFCHGTSMNKLDFFEKYKNRGKFDCEVGIMARMDGVFVASEYHRRKLASFVRHAYDGWSRPQIHDLGALPLPPDRLIPEFRESPKNNYIGILGGKRIGQKRILEHEGKFKDIMDSMGIQYKYIHGDSWEEYFKMLYNAAYCVTFPAEETYGYQVSDSLMVGTQVLAVEDSKHLGHSEMLYDGTFFPTVQHLATFIANSYKDTSDLSVEFKNLHKIHHFYENMAKVIFA